MDHDDQEILAMTILDKRHAGGKSNSMELIGFKTTLEKLLAKDINVVEVVTDQHPQVIKFLSKYWSSFLVLVSI